MEHLFYISDPNLFWPLVILVIVLIIIGSVVIYFSDEEKQKENFIKKYGEYSHFKGYIEESYTEYEENIED